MPLPDALGVQRTRVAARAGLAAPSTLVPTAGLVLASGLFSIPHSFVC